MEQLLIEAGKETPQVHCDGNNGIFSFSGKSYPENVNVFYQSIFEYIEIYKSTPAKKTLLEFNWLYYNTATSKMIVKIIMQLKDLSNDFEIKWLCKSDFDLIIEKGKEIKEVFDVNLIIVFTDGNNNIEK